MYFARSSSGAGDTAPPTMSHVFRQVVIGCRFYRPTRNMECRPSCASIEAYHSMGEGIQVSCSFVRVCFLAVRLKCGGKVMPVDVEHAHALCRGATASIVKAKVRKWSAKKSPAAEAKRHKKDCASASSSDRLHHRVHVQR